MTANASLAERSAAYDARKRAGGLCIEGGCWRKAAKARVRCQSHLDAARATAAARRNTKGTQRANAGAPIQAKGTAGCSNLPPKRRKAQATGR